ncbi:hypothetical protein FHY09_001729 [Xanthomonas sp. 60]
MHARNALLSRCALSVPRCKCRSRAAITRARTASLRSPSGVLSRSSSGYSRGTVTCRSIRSSNGPDTRPR